MTTKAIGYIRVSTEEQASEGVSLSAQRAKLEAYANLYDLDLVTIIEDCGQSAKSLNRPGIQRALDMLKAGKADGLLIPKLDRLSRSVADWNYLIDGFFGEKAGKSLWSVADSIDTRTAAGRMVLNILMSVAQWEREAIAERTKESLAFKKSRGEKLGGNVPYGFDLAEDGKTLTENAREQEIIRRIQNLKAEDYKLRQIVDSLNQDGIATKKGKKWKITQIHRILKRKSA